MVWVVMGFVGGFYQGRAKTKLLLFVGSTVFITVRNLILAKVWEQAQADGFVSMRQLLAATISHAASADERTARVSTELLVNGWFSFVCACLLGLAIGMLARARSQNTVEATQAELLRMVELDERTVAEARAKVEELAQLQKHAQELDMHAQALEAARREALVSQVRQRGTSKRSSSSARTNASGRGHLNAFQEEMDVDMELMTLPGDALDAADARLE